MEVVVYHEGAASSTLVAKCSICVDQLKIGQGVREEFRLIKDAKKAGVITIQSKYQGLDDHEMLEDTAPLKDLPIISLPPVISIKTAPQNVNMVISPRGGAQMALFGQVTPIQQQTKANAMSQ